MQNSGLWYVRNEGGGALGPYDAPGVIQLIRRRELGGSSWICPVGEETWAPLGSDVAFAQILASASPDNPFPRGYVGRDTPPAALAATAEPPQAPQPVGSAAELPAPPPIPVATQPRAEPESPLPFPAAHMAALPSSVQASAPVKPFREESAPFSVPARPGRFRTWALAATIGASVAAVGVVVYGMASRSDVPDAPRARGFGSTSGQVEQRVRPSTAGSYAQKASCGCADDDLECALRCAKRR